MSLYQRFFLILLFCVSTAGLSDAAAPESLRDDAEKALDRAVTYLSSIAVQGGYQEGYAATFADSLHNGTATVSSIDVIPPGTPTVGRAFVRAYRLTGNPDHLAAAAAAANALIGGQNASGGWNRRIRLNAAEPDQLCKIWSPVTQPALEFLMEMADISADAKYKLAVDRALQCLLVSQFDNGGWPPFYPLRGGPYNCCSMNDGSFNACVDVLLQAYRRYGRADLLYALKSAANFLHAAQLPPPQAGWAQHYTLALKPTWFREYEPPSVNSKVTASCITTLMDLYLYLPEGFGSEVNEREWYLYPIPEALRWLEASRLPNGRWARFYELGTNVPLYFDQGRVRAESLEQLGMERRTGYGWHQTIPVEELKARFQAIKKLGREQYLALLDGSPPANGPRHTRMELEQQVKEIIQQQEASGRWTSNEHTRKGVRGTGQWDGQYAEEVRLECEHYTRNIQLLCDYLEQKRGE